MVPLAGGQVPSVFNGLSRVVRHFPRAENCRTPGALSNPIGLSVQLVWYACDEIEDRTTTRLLIISDCRLCLRQPELGRSGRIADVVMVLIKIPKMSVSSKKKSVSSNKTQTLPDKTLTEDIPSPPQVLSTAWAPTPFIDKLSVLLDPVNDHHALEIYSALMVAQDDMPEKAKDPTDGLFIDAGKGGKWGPFRWAKRVILPSIVD
jgi:hypothetical protein